MKYDYKCKSCGLEQVEEHPMVDDALTLCPRCMLTTYRRVVSSQPFLLKGDGWESHETSGRYHPVGGT